jgi:hypothetical protein
MHEPDEALLWAREQSVQFWESLAAKGLPPETVAAHVALARSGGYDSQLEQEAEGRRNWLEGYRAGQAASAERIKTLEEALRPLAECEITEPDVLIPDDYGARYFITYGEIRRARALLKEADQ